MATKTDYQRGVVFEDINHDRVANAIRYLSFAKLYYPEKYHEFLKFVALHHATWSMEDSNFILALYEFETSFSEFLKLNQNVEQELNRLSPKQMVDRVDIEEINDVKMRRDAARKIAERAVANATKRGAVQQAIQTAAVEAETPAAFQKLVQQRAPESASAISGIIKEDPVVVQKILFSDPESTRGMLEHVTFSPLPNKRALHTIITTLPMDPAETREAFLNRAEAVARTAMVLSSDLSQTPAARATPAGFVEAILSVQKDRRAVDALRAFSKLTQQAKNAVSLAVVAKVWEGAAGNAQWKELVKQPLGRAGVLVSDVLGPLLGSAFERAAAAETITNALRGKTATATAALFLVAVEQHPTGVRFEATIEPAGWFVRWAADSAFGKLVDRATKSEVTKGIVSRIFQGVLGFFGKEGAKKAAGAAVGAAAKKGVGALLGRIIGGLIGSVGGPVGAVLGWVAGSLVVPIVKKVWGLATAVLSGRAFFGWATNAIQSALGVPAPGRQKQWYEQDWVWVAALVVAPIIIIFIPFVFFASRDSAMILGFEEGRLFVGTEQDFAEESAAQPDLSRVSPKCLGNDFPAPAATGVRTKIINGREYAFPVAPYDRTYHTCGHHDGLDATDIGIRGVNTDNPHAGLAVVAYTDGVISMTRLDDPKGGRYVILRGDDGKSYYYAHNCALYVRSGERVSAGQVIASTGDTGSAATTPEHLHFAISGAGESFYAGGDACPAYDFEQKFGLGKCSAAQLCPSR